MSETPSIMTETVPSKGGLEGLLANKKLCAVIVAVVVVLVLLLLWHKSSQGFLPDPPFGTRPKIGFASIGGHYLGGN